METYCNSSDITAKRHITPPPENFGNVTSLLGVSIRQNHSKRVKYLTQNIYKEGILDNFRMINSKAVSPPPAPGAQAEEIQYFSDSYPFHEAFGSLLYTINSTRPEIYARVGVGAQAAGSPRTSNRLDLESTLH